MTEQTNREHVSSPGQQRGGHRCTSCITRVYYVQAQARPRPRPSTVAATRPLYLTFMLVVHVHETTKALLSQCIHPYPVRQVTFTFLHESPELHHVKVRVCR